MNKLVILFKSSSQHTASDLNLNRNLDLLAKMPGVQSIHTSVIVGGPMTPPPYHRMVEVFFKTLGDLDAALTSPEGVAAGKHLMSFGGTKVDILFTEELDPTEQPFTPDTLQAYLDQQTIPAEIIWPGKPTPTVPSAAKALGVENEQIVKSILFMVEGRPFLALGCGTPRIDSRKLADRLNVAHNQVKPASPEQVRTITGYRVGTVPPFGFKVGKIPTFMDPNIQNHEVIYAGGGGNDALLKITSADLQRFTNAEVLPLMLVPSETASPAPTRPPDRAESASESNPSQPPSPNTEA